MMRLLFFSNVFPNPLTPQKGTFNASLINAFAEQGPVHVVSPVAWLERLRGTRFPDVLSSSTEHGLNLRPSVTVRYPTFFYSPKVLRSQYGRFLDWSVGKQLQEDIRQFRPDAVVSYWAHPDGEVALKAARRAGIPSISMVGGSDVLLLARAGSRRKAIMKVLRETDAVIAVSSQIASHLQQAGIPEQSLHVVRRGMDKQLFCPGDQRLAREKLGLPNDRKILIAVGRLVPVKGLSVLVDACRHLRDRSCHFSCYVLGSGPLLGSLQAQVDRLGLQDFVSFPGGQTQSALADWYRSADLTVLPSISEGIPNVLLESIACGVPFVATRVGGIPEIADPDLHRLVEAENPEALATAIADQIHHRPPKVRPRFEPESWSDSAASICEIIENIRHPQQELDNDIAEPEPVTAMANHA